MRATWACGRNTTHPRWVCFLSHKHTSTLPLAPSCLGPTWHAPCVALQLMESWPAKVAQQLLSSQLVTDGGVVRLSIRMHFTWRSSEDLSAVGRCKGRSDRMQARGTRLPADRLVENFTPWLPYGYHINSEPLFEKVY